MPFFAVNKVFPGRCLAGTLVMLLPLALAAQTYTISTIAGNNSRGYSGDGGPATSAQLAGPVGVAVDSGGTLYISDQFNQRIRQVSSGTINVTAGTGTAGNNGDNGKPLNAQLNNPSGLAVDSSGNLYIADTNNSLIRKIAGGTLTTLTGNIGLGAGYGGDGGQAVGAQVNGPNGVAVDGSGNIYIADTNNHAVRKISGGNISTVVGNGNPGSNGDGGLATAAVVNAPRGVAVDLAGNVYIADSSNHKVRKITIATGIITTVAGTGVAGFSGDNGAAVNAQLNRPTSVAVDKAGNIYIADFNNSRIRKVSVTGTITTIAGSRPGYGGDGGPGTSAQLQFPTGVAIDGASNVYIADTQNNVVRMLTPPAAVPGAPPSISTAASAGGFGGFTSIAPGSWIEVYGSSLASGTRSWGDADFRGINAPTSLDNTVVTVGGQPAFVAYISPTQVNAQVPSNIATGTQQIYVSTPVGPSSAFAITVNATQPGLLAPPQFNIGGTPYVAAVFTDGATYVLPQGALAGVTSRPAKPGETIVLYGVGFGPVSPNIAAGVIATLNNSLTTTPFQIQLGGVTAQVTYQGLAPGTVGLYQFNVVVPNAGPGDVPLTFTLGTNSGSQNLFVAVGQ